MIGCLLRRTLNEPATATHKFSVRLHSAINDPNIFEQRIRERRETVVETKQRLTASIYSDLSVNDFHVLWTECILFDSKEQMQCVCRNEYYTDCECGLNACLYLCVGLTFVVFVLYLKLTCSELGSYRHVVPSNNFQIQNISIRIDVR